MDTITLIAYLPDLSGVKFVIKKNKADGKPLFYFVFPPDYLIKDENEITEAIASSAIQKHFYIPLNKTITIQKGLSESLKEIANDIRNNSKVLRS